MYDRATRTLWHQFTGEPIIGELQGSGIRLDWFPTARTTWGAWRAEFPHTTVLDRARALYPENSYSNESDPRSIYYAYRADPETMFPISDRDAVLPPKTEVLGVQVGEMFRAYTLSDLRRARIVHDEIDGVPVLVLAAADTSDAHVYLNERGESFTLADDGPAFPTALLDDRGRRYEVTRYAITRNVDSRAGSIRLQHVPSNVNFWFGWHAFRPETELWRPRESEGDG